MQWRILPRPKCLSCSLPCSSTTSCKKPGGFPRYNEQINSESSQRSKSFGDGRSSSSPAAEVIEIESLKPSLHQRTNGGSSFKHRRGGDKSSSQCGCLFLPGSSTSQKKKQVVQRSNTTLIPATPKRHEDEEEEEEEEKIDMESMSAAVSRVASLERFEYESWSSSAILDGDDDDDGVQSFFDLPLELIRSSRNGTNSPVKAAFVFESERKGSLKKTLSKLTSQKSLESSTNRHVRFSTSPTSPSACVSPTMQKAREEFHAFLEARSA
ncbi:hypothetical protein Cni_G21785 [Canna indica]|uniref:Uncharacterized protein n=1 Tax=Canna indica TaxID=4628 RepID=A0AAQ3KVL0_9LILI|nr:hypothetical protein Cni_G21785 [Canna indica]